MTSKTVVTFKSEGAECEGELVLPSGFQPCGSYPPLARGHSFTVSRSSLVEESRIFAEAAYAAAGEPKQLFCTPNDQLDCYKPDGRAQTIGAAIGFFDACLKQG